MLECEMELADLLDRMDRIDCERVHESFFEESLDFFRRRGDMRSDADIFSWFAESTREFIIDSREEHPVDEEYEVEREFFVFCLDSHILYHFREVASFIDFSDMEIFGGLHIEEDLLGIR